MTARTAWRRTVPLVVVFVTLSVPARAETFAECVERAYAQAVAGSQQWQRDFRALLAKARPDLAPLATLEMEHQLALIDRRQARFRYVLRADAGRIYTRDGLAAFRNFDWTEADAGVLRQQNPAYAAIERNVAELERQVRAHSGWPAMRDYVRTTLSVNPQFQELTERFQERERGIEPVLRTCQPGA
jgi:hypothetical protein